MMSDRTLAERALAMMEEMASKAADTETPRGLLQHLERQALVDYLLSDDYRPMLTRAILLRLHAAQSRPHAAKHTKALDLLKAAFPRNGDE